MDQIFDRELEKKVKDSSKVLRAHREDCPNERQEWLVIKQEFLLRNMLAEQIYFIQQWI